jgi:hypothetical protein
MKSLKENVMLGDWKWAPTCLLFLLVLAIPVRAEVTFETERLSIQIDHTGAVRYEESAGTLTLPYSQGTTAVVKVRMPDSRRG